MGIAKGYDWNALEPFVTSFKRNCSSAELVLFVDDISDFTREQLIRGGGKISLLDIPDEYKNILVIHTRWKMYHDFLETHGDDYSQVFVTDVRDVIFQGDVFAAFENHSNYLGCVTEDDDINGSKTGDKCNFNWMVRAFGQEETNKLKNKAIICCGTVIGTVNEMKVLCREMWVALADAKRWGHEQAQMNYFVHNNLLPIENLTYISVEDGEVLTVALFKRKRPIVIRDNMIRRGDGGIPAVVHQYERSREAVQLADKIYRDKNFQADEKFTDTRSNLEQIWQLVFFDKFNDATRFSMKKIVIDTDFDNDINQLLRFWEKLFKKPSLTPVVGYFELLIQSALSSVKKHSVEQLNTICEKLNHSFKNGHIIAPQFVNFIVQNLLDTDKQSFNAKNAHICLFCTETVNVLPLDKNLLLLKAKAYRILGKKEEALEAYTKALDLN